MSDRRLILPHVGLARRLRRPAATAIIDWLTPRGEGVVDHGDRRHRANLEMFGEIGLIAMGRARLRADGPGLEQLRQPDGAGDQRAARRSSTRRRWPRSTGPTPGSRRAAITDEIPQLKAEGGKDIVVFGGGHFGHSLIRERLADELRLTVHPVALGDGISLYHGLPEPQRFELVSSTVYADGCVSQVLRPGLSTSQAAGPAAGHTW